MLQSCVCSLGHTHAYSWTHLGLWYSNCECKLNHFCMALHYLQLPAGIAQTISHVILLSSHVLV